MKKILLLSAMLYLTTSVFAQYVEVTPLTGYTFSGDVDAYYGTYDMENAMLYGIRLEAEVADLTYVGLSYRRNDPNVVEYVSGQNPVGLDFGTAHYMAGILREFKKGKVTPFGVLGAGTTRYWAKNIDYHKWFFSTEFGVGAKYFFSEAIGLRLQAAVTTPWDFAGGGLFFGVGTGGGGASADMTFNVPIAHWDLSAGLIFRIKD